MGQRAQAGLDALGCRSGHHHGIGFGVLVCLCVAVMKTLFASVAAACAFAGAAIAIPQTFGIGNGFFGATGQQFEDFAIAAVGPGAELKGKWAPVRGGDGKRRLDVTAVVFGVQASEVTAETSANGGTKYRVLYRAADDRKRGRQAASLRERVAAGIRSYTGADAGKPVPYKGALVTLAEGAKGDVSVEITKAP
jgi:hypothetical protein